jgi:hypothetical protein
MPLGAEKIDSLICAKRHGVVCADVMRNHRHTFSPPNQGGAMSKDTLKKFRLIVPGVMIVFAFLPLFNLKVIPQVGAPVYPLFQSLSSLLPDYVISSLALIICGVLYYTLNIRYYFIRESHKNIQLNIKSTLLSPFGSDPLLAPKFASLRQGRTLMNIFYDFVDNDESLKVKAGSVYFNGLLWSSFADLQAVSLIATVVYLACFLLFRDNQFTYLAIICLALSLIARFILLPRVTAQHIELSNEQLEFILQKYPKELREKLVNSAGKQG